MLVDGPQRDGQTPKIKVLPVVSKDDHSSINESLTKWVKGKNLPPTHGDSSFFFFFCLLIPLTEKRGKCFHNRVFSLWRCT